MTDIQLKCFLTAAALENFTKAAEKLYITQPVLGRHIANLETELAVQLFQREGKSVHLTHYGMILAEHFRKFEAEFETVMKKIRAEQRSQSNSIVLATVNGQQIGEIYFPAIQYLSEKFPEVKLRIRYTDSNRELLDELAAGTVDVAITSIGELSQREERFEYSPLMEFQVGLIVPVANHLLQKKNLCPEDFADEPFITLSDSEPYAMAALEQLMQRIGTKTRLTAPDIPTFNLMLESNLGISGTNSCSKICKDPRFVFLPHQAVNEKECIAIAVWSKSSSNPCINMLLQALHNTGFSLEQA